MPDFRIYQNSNNWNLTNKLCSNFNDQIKLWINLTRLMFRLAELYISLLWGIAAITFMNITYKTYTEHRFNTLQPAVQMVAFKIF